MRILDLFCGAGGAGMGYHRAGFEVVGVDIKPQPHYPFPFVQGEALILMESLLCGWCILPTDGKPYWLEDFDAIHASPPCQYGSVATPLRCRNNHPNLIPRTRELFTAAPIPYVIENVPNNRKDLICPYRLCGSSFGLQAFRHRYFEMPWFSGLVPPCRHDFRPLLVTTAGKNSRDIRQPGQYKSVRNAPKAYGVDWMTSDELKEAIPPAYTEWIGNRFKEFSQTPCTTP